MIILKVSVCAQSQGEIIANIFTDDLNHFFDHIGTYMEFIFLAGRAVLIRKKPRS